MTKKLIPNVFMWLFIGLLITFIGGYVISLNENALRNIYTSNLYWIFVVAELVIAFVLNLAVTKLSKPVAICLYILYTFLTGITISFLFLAYKLSSIIIIFLITSILFAIFALIGKYTKIDLSKFWIYLIIGLLAIIVLEIVNVFVLSEKLNMITCILGIIIFLGYIAYDMQRIIKSEEFDGITEGSYPIVFAFNLYIDFINLFIDLMRLFGDSND